MDIAAVSTILAQGKVMSQVGVSVAKMGMDMAEQQGQALTRLIDASSLELSVNPNIGANIDIKL